MLISKKMLKPLFTLHQRLYIWYSLSYIFFLGCDPTIMGIGPAPASRAALKASGLELKDMELVEVYKNNERQKKHPQV